MLLQQEVLCFWMGVADADVLSWHQGSLACMRLLKLVVDGTLTFSAATAAAVAAVRCVMF